jgi:hypothetical protein
MHTYTDTRHLTTPDGRAVYEAVCYLLGVPPAVMDALAFFVRCLPSPCDNLRVELGVLSTDATIDAEGLLRRSGHRASVGGPDILNGSTYAPRVRVAFRAGKPDYGGARNDVERLAYVEHTATVPMLSGNDGIANAVSGLGGAIESAAARARRVPLRNAGTMASRDTRCLKAAAAARGLGNLAMALRVPGADAALTLRNLTPGPGTVAP